MLNLKKLRYSADSPLSPLIRYADYAFSRSDVASFVDSLVAPMSVLNALIVAISLKKKDEISESLSNLEKIWTEYQVYDNEDGDLNLSYSLNKKQGG